MAADHFDLPITIIDTPASLEGALPEWFSAGLLAVDIECSLTGVHHCALALVQIATHDKAWLLDPIALEPLMKATIKALAEIPWIVHDFSGDGIVFKRIYDVIPKSVMDTMMLARALGYPQPGLKTMAKLHLGVDIPKEEQDSNWMLRPLRQSQISYAARDSALLLPLLRRLADEAEIRKADPEYRARLSNLPTEMRHLLSRVRHYQSPSSFPVVEKARSLGLGSAAVERATLLSEMRVKWGNEGDIAAVMELGNRWILQRIQNPPHSIEALARTIPNPRFRAKRLDALWEILGK